MSTCFNVRCLSENPDNSEVCQECGASLIIGGRYRALRLLQPLEAVSFRHQVFEVVDLISDGLKILHLFQADPQFLRSIDSTRLLLGQVHAIEPSIHFPKIEPDASFEWRLSPNAAALQCLVMEKVEGVSLEEWLSRYGRIPQSLAIDWMTQIVEAVDTMHKHGFIHRDIKPANIILRPDGALVLIDFAAVCRTDFDYLASLNQSSQFTSQIDVVGTPGYMAPEQLDGKALPLSDYFSIGRTFCHLVTGVSPLRLARSGSGRLRWRSQAGQISPIFANFLDRLMAANSLERPANRAEILSYLNALPKRLRWRNAVHSKTGRFFIAMLTGLLLICLWQAATYGLFYFYMAEANEYRLQGNNQLAKERYSTALNFRQTADGYVSLSVACQTLSDTNCAITSLEKAIKLAPNEVAAYFNLGSIYELQQDYDQAYKLYEKASHLAGSVRFDAINNLARLHLLQSQQAQASKLLNSAVGMVTDPITNAAMKKNLAWAAFQNRQFSEAQKLLSESARLDPKRAATYCLAALVDLALEKDSLSNTITCFNLPTPVDQPEVAEWKMELLLANSPQR